jgi:hypothetical protein
MSILTAPIALSQHPPDATKSPADEIHKDKTQHEKRGNGIHPRVKHNGLFKTQSSDKQNGRASSIEDAKSRVVAASLERSPPSKMRNVPALESRLLQFQRVGQ